MNIEKIKLKNNLNTTRCHNLKKVTFNGKLLCLKTAKETIPFNDIYTKTFEGEINWLTWIGKRAKHSFTKKGTLSDSGKELFKTFKNAFEEDENRKFLNNLFATSKENAKVYKKQFEKIIGQFQRAGVSYSESEELKSGLDFIEGINNYSSKENLLLKKIK